MTLKIWINLNTQVNICLFRCNKIIWTSDWISEGRKQKFQF